MPRARKPRAGSMQFWPRVRARQSYARIRTWPTGKEAKPLGFAGYKAGMTHLLIEDNSVNSLSKGADIFCPVTVIECPPLKAFSIRFYKNTQDGLKLVSESPASHLDKEIERKIIKSKKKGKETVDERANDIASGAKLHKPHELSHSTDFDFLRLLCHTQPKLTGIGKSKPEIFEVAIGGDKEQQMAYAKEKLGNEISISEVFKEGQMIDTHSLTRGKGFQGPMKRFGIQLRHHKSEKSRRNPGTLGSWRAQGQIMWRVAHAGKMGYHLRTEYNKWIMKIGNKAEEINPKGGFVNYGVVKNPYVLLKGSVSGAQKRMIRLIDSIRAKRSISEPPPITYISTESKQGN
ncbi:50S ribosomal protein L3 [Candidatus Woesearchaeota archaeon]|nr:50S ribosomal protein L3 [Candidatus Woesearchaeota archaeon]